MRFYRYLGFFLICTPLTGLTEQPLLPPSASNAYVVNDDIASDEIRVSYLVGYRLGKNLAELDIGDLDYQALWKGLLEAESEMPSRYTEIESSQAYARYFEWKQLQKKQLQADNLEKALQFLTANLERESIVATASGLQYQVMTAGSGPQVQLLDWVRIRYHTKLVDGTFISDSSETPAGVWVPVAELIPAWTEALLLMPVGSRWMLYAGPELTFGNKPPLKSIPANAALVFDIELLEVRPSVMPDAAGEE